MSEETSREFTAFDYLLNAFEQASQSQFPAELHYGDKRKRLYAHVRELERQAASAPAQAERIERLEEALRRAYSFTKDFRGRKSDKLNKLIQGVLETGCKEAK